MSRQKQKGTAFETAAAKDYSATFPGVRRRALEGANDKGDLEGLEVYGQEIVIECKDYKSYQIAQWIDELEAELENANSPFGFVLFHRARKGLADMDAQLVLTTNKAMKWLLKKGNHMQAEIHSDELNELKQRLAFVEEEIRQGADRESNLKKALVSYLIGACFNLEREVENETFGDWVDNAIYTWAIPEHLSRAEVKTLCNSELYKVYLAQALKVKDESEGN